MKVIRLEDKLPKPDFKGEWVRKDHYSEYFSLYILGRSPFTGNIDDSTFEKLGTSIEVIEGVITDSLGLAIFSGKIGNIGTEFRKDYSYFAQEKGGEPHLYYFGYAKRAVIRDSPRGAVKALELNDIDIHFPTTLIPNSPDDVIRYEGIYNNTGRRRAHKEDALGTFWMERVDS